MSKLPESWGVSSIGELCEPSQYGWTTSASSDATTNVKFLRTTDISNGTIDWQTVPFCTETPDDLSRYLLKTNDIVISRAGSIGLSTLVENPDPSVFASYLIRFVPRDEVQAKYLAYFLKSPSYWNRIREVASGIALQNVNAKKLSAIEVPVAPSQEQARIVAEVEKQFTRLDAATAALKRVQANLKRYRASVLKAACEGRLVPTEAELARKEGRDYEPADKLLQRILRERRSRWEADTLAKMQASGKPPKNDDWKQKYKEPSAPDISNLPTLPEDWCWISLDSLIFGITAGRSFKCDERPPVDCEYGVVKVSSVTWGMFDEVESKTCMAGSPWIEAYRIRPDDFLFSRANTIELVGACVITRNVERKLMLSDKILRFEIVLPLLKQWLLIVLRSKWGRSEIERLSTGNQESMRNIGQDRIRSIRVPLPPSEEMGRIVTAMEAIEAGFMHLEESSTAQIKRSASLRRAVLGCAFAGQLVPQDPTDEPASALLERIRAQRSASGTDRPARRNRKEAIVG